MALHLSQEQYGNMVGAIGRDAEALKALFAMIQSGEVVVAPVVVAAPAVRLTRAQRSLLRKIEAAPDGKFVTEQYSEDHYTCKGMPQIDKDANGRGRPLTIITRSWVSAVQIEVNPHCIQAIIEALGRSDVEDCRR